MVARDDPIRDLHRPGGCRSSAAAFRDRDLELATCRGGDHALPERRRSVRGRPAPRDRHRRTTGAPVVAAVPGLVRFAGTAGSSGRTVSVRSDDGRFDVSYLHLSSIAVQPGDRFPRGAVIGAVGTTGVRSAERPHLHFGVREAGSRHAYLDPLSLLPPPAAQAPRPPQAVPVPAPAPARPDPISVPTPRAPAVRAPLPAARRVPGARPAPAPGAVGERRSIRLARPHPRMPSPTEPRLRPLTAPRGRQSGGRRPRRGAAGGAAPCIQAPGRCTGAPGERRTRPRWGRTRPRTDRGRCRTAGGRTPRRRIPSRRRGSEHQGEGARE